MNDLDKILTSTTAMVWAIAGALVSKGVISKTDLLNDLTVQSYDFPLPAIVLADLQKMIRALPDPEA